MLKDVIDYYCGAQKNPRNNCGIGDMVIAAHVMERLAFANPGKSVRFIVQNSNMLVWASALWSNCESWSTVLEPGEQTIWQVEEASWKEVDLQCAEQKTNRIDFILKRLGLPTEFPTRMLRIPSEHTLQFEAGKFKELMEKVEQKPIGRIAFAPQSTRVVRDWPLRHWVRLWDLFKKEGYEPGTIGVSSKENSLEGFPGMVTLDRHPRDLLAILRNSDLIIGPDSGPLHLASLVDRPALAICGPTDGQVVFGHYSTHRWINNNFPCSPCNFVQVEGRYNRACEYGCEALNRILPEQVFARAMELLKR